MLFITNKPPLTAMGDVLHDHDLAEAIVDRVLEPCVYQSTDIRMGVTSVPIDNRLCGENENCAPTPRASIDDMGGRRLAVVIIAPPIYTMAIKVAFDGLGALLVIGQLPATRGRPRWVPGSGAGPSWSIRRSVGRAVHGDRLRHRELRCRTVGGHFDVQHGAGNVLRIIVAVTTALSDSWSTGTSPAVP